tara:strand:+ start:9328 stop:9597 length:270 start_codon:yes stop_codon:yes gene_type:complete
MKTYKIIITGKVQGVFFRDNTKKQAISLGIKGYIKNSEKGEVEAVFQGPEEKLKEIMEWCKIGPTTAEVESVNIEEIKNSKEYNSFDII